MNVKQCQMPQEILHEPLTGEYPRRTFRAMTAWCGGFAMIALFASSVRAEPIPVVVQNASGGPDVTHDSYLEDGTSNVDENNGGDVELQVAERSNDRDTVIRFDLPTIPPGAQIVSASLSMYYWKDYGMSSTDWMDVTIYPLKSDWTEGTGSGQGGNERSGTSWTFRHAYPSVSQWHNGGARHATHDRDTNYTVTRTLYGNPIPDWVTWSGQKVTDVVAQWYADTRDNDGWVIDYTGTNEDHQGVHFHSSEFSSAVARPKLNFEYEVIPEPSTFALLAAGIVGLLAYVLRENM